MASQRNVELPGIAKILATLREQSLQNDTTCTQTRTSSSGPDKYSTSKGNEHPKELEKPLETSKASKTPPTATPRPLRIATTTFSIASKSDSKDKTPPFTEPQTFAQITCRGRPLEPYIHAEIKGAPLNWDGTWSCYRRKGISVDCSYALMPPISGGDLYLHRGRHFPERVQALAVSISAGVTEFAGPYVALVQHTPDHGKKVNQEVGKVKIAPTPNPQSQIHAYGPSADDCTVTCKALRLPLQYDPCPATVHFDNSDAIPSQYTFDRLRFWSDPSYQPKGQSFHRVFVELWADVRGVGEMSPKWVKVAQRASAPIVVRGRIKKRHSYHGRSSSSRNKPTPDDGDRRDAHDVVMATLSSPTESFKSLPSPAESSFGERSFRTYSQGDRTPVLTSGDLFYNRSFRDKLYSWGPAKY